MKHTWLVVVAVGAASAGAGVAIAGLPEEPEAPFVIVPPAGPTTTLAVVADGSAPDAPRQAAAAVTETGVERADVRVVIAGGPGNLAAAAAVAQGLGVAGYRFVTISEPIGFVDGDRVYARAGFDGAGEMLITDLGLDAMVESLPLEPVTQDDSDADLVVILGNDPP